MGAIGLIWNGPRGRCTKTIESSPAVLPASFPSSAAEKAKEKEVKINLNSPSEGLAFTGQHALPGPCPDSALTSRL